MARLSFAKATGVVNPQGRPDGSRHFGGYHTHRCLKFFDMPS
jgi:hypothetical protein